MIRSLFLHCRSGLWSSDKDSRKMIPPRNNLHPLQQSARRRHARLSTWAAAIATLMGLSGCDTMYGINRTGTVLLPSSWECIANSIRSVPGITKVTYRRDEGSRPVTWRGVQRPDQVHRFLYQTTDLSNQLYFLERFDGTIQYFHGRGYLNHKPPQAELDRFIPWIHLIEDSLNEKCGLGKISAKEYCTGMRCEIPGH